MAEPIVRGLHVRAGRGLGDGFDTVAGETFGVEGDYYGEYDDDYGEEEDEDYGDYAEEEEEEEEYEREFGDYYDDDDDDVEGEMATAYSTRTRCNRNRNNFRAMRGVCRRPTLTLLLSLCVDGRGLDEEPFSYSRGGRGGSGRGGGLRSRATRGRMREGGLCCGVMATRAVPRRREQQAGIPGT